MPTGISGWLWNASARSILGPSITPSSIIALHAADAFFGRLKHQLHGAGELRRQVLQHRSDAEQRGGVDVVAAGVHQAGIVLANGRPDVLLDRQRVHVGPDGEHRARATALNQADDARLADAGLMGNAEAAQFARDDPGGADLLEAEFGMGVDVATDVDQARVRCAGWRRGSRWWDRWGGTWRDFDLRLVGLTQE